MTSTPVVLNPKPPSGTPADVFSDRVVVPTVLVHAVGAANAVVLTVLLAQPDLGAVDPSQLLHQIGVDSDTVEQSLRFLRNAGLVTMSVTPEDTDADPDAGTGDEFQINEPNVADLINTVTARHHVDADNNDDTDDVDPERQARLVEAERLCRLLADLIVANGSKRPTITRTWISDMEKLVRIDQRTPTQVEHAILWCQADPFWAPNIESPFKLRKQFDKLRHNAAREGKPVALQKMQRSRDLLTGNADRQPPDQQEFVDGITVNQDWAEEFGVNEESVHLDVTEEP